MMSSHCSGEVLCFSLFRRSSEQLATVGIGVGLLDFLGIIIIAAAILLAIVAGCSRAAGAIGEQTVERGYIDPNIFSRN